jgi:hypothetical protein
LGKRGGIGSVEVAGVGNNGGGSGSTMDVLCQSAEVNVASERSGHTRPQRAP